MNTEKEFTFEMPEEISKHSDALLAKRAEILEQFCEAYLAEMMVKMPMSEIIQKIEMVEQHQRDGSIRWFFREKQ